MPASPPVADPGHDDAAPAVGVPAVVAVVVTRDAGPWLEETLMALGDQDYPNLSVLVIDAASAVDPTARIATTLPSAYVRRLDANPGFAAAANEVIGVVEGASHYVVLHDDAAPDPDAVRLMVEEAFRSNAGIVTPKLVDWDDPMRILGVGASADKAGVVRPYGRDELDQEQHDSVRDVFVAPGGCTLVRVDLFESLGGFDGSLVMLGEDLDLCWRAQIAGARVVVAPGARVRHREATVNGLRTLVLGGLSGQVDTQIARLRFRHRLRSVLKTYSAVHLLRVLPQLIVSMVAEALVALAGGRRQLAGAVVDAWRWNLSNRGDLRATRKAAQQHRTLKDGEVRRLQTRGSVRLSSALRGGLEAEERTLGFGQAGRQWAGSVVAGGLGQMVAVWSALAVVLAFGSRGLLSGRFPAIGQFVPFPDSPFTLLGAFVSGWRTSGLGAEAPAPAVFAFIGTLGIVFVGAMGVLHRVLILGLLPLGLFGMHRLTAPLGSWRVRLAGVVLYAGVPVPYDALAAGRWGGLVAYAAAPWILGRLLRATGLEPFGTPTSDEAVVRRTPSRRAVRPTPAGAVEDLLGAEAGTMDPIDAEELRVAAGAVTGLHHGGDGDVVVVPAGRLPAPLWVRYPGSLAFQAAAAAAFLAVVAAFVPSILLAVLLVGVGIVAGSVLVGDVGAAARALAVGFVASIGAAVLLAPWTLELVLPGSTWSAFAGIGRAKSAAPGLGELVRFGVGPFSRSPMVWALLVAAAFPLVVGRRWRFGWAARLWAVAIVAWGASWALGRGWFGVSPPAIDVVLAPAAAAIVLAAVLGLSAFEIDLPSYRFGWPHVASVVAALAGGLSILPVLAGTLDGQWRIPERDVPQLVSWMDERGDDGLFRVLWAGAAEVLPVDGWRLGDGLAYGSSRGGRPDLVGQWPASDQGSTGLLRDALDVSRRGETSRLGHLLAPLGVRYVAVPLRLGPARAGGAAVAVPDDLLAALRAQIDLRLIQSDETLVVYENAAWAPAVSVLPPAAVAPSQGSGLEVARTTELGGAPKALERDGATRYSGGWPGPELYFAESYSSRWSFDAGDAQSVHRKAFGWSNAWTAPAAERATLSYSTSPLRYISVLLEIALWVGVIRWIVLGLRERARVTGP